MDRDPEKIPDYSRERTWLKTLKIEGILSNFEVIYFSAVLL